MARISIFCPVLLFAKCYIVTAESSINQNFHSVRKTMDQVPILMVTEWLRQFSIKTREVVRKKCQTNTPLTQLVLSLFFFQKVYIVQTPLSKTSIPFFIRQEYLFENFVRYHSNPSVYSHLSTRMHHKKNLFFYKISNCLKET